jgi:dipeptidyl aminopeptidase/acylaminoacyl peptidase
MLGRVSAKGGAAPEPILGVSGDAHWPSISVRGPLRIAYQWRSETTNIIRWDLASNHTAAVAPSLRFDANPQLSPDESKVAFASDRDGFRELWIVNADGSSPKRLTNLRRPFTDSPRWSPDGKTIAFSTTEGENREIYTMPSEGGEIRRMTNSPSEEGRPSWSADGKFIYFRSDLGGTKNIWRVPAAGGSPEQLTRKGGYEAFASADRKWIYFAKDRAELGLWRIPAAGGAEEKISDEIREGQWGLAVKSVWYLKPKPEWGLWRLDLETRRAELAAPMEPRQRIYSGMTVNANGTAILYSKAVAQNSDVALLEFAKP